RSSDLESPRAEQPSASERFWKSTPVALLSLVLMISGIAGVSALVSSPDLTGWRMGFDADTAVRAAAACFAFATAFVIGMGVSWLRGGRERSGSASGGVLLLCLVPAVASLLIINGDNVLDPWSPWARSEE